MVTRLAEHDGKCFHWQSWVLWDKKCDMSGDVFEDQNTRMCCMTKLQGDKVHQETFTESPLKAAQGCPSLTWLDCWECWGLWGCFSWVGSSFSCDQPWWVSSADLWLAALELEGLLPTASGVPRLLHILGFLLRFSPHSLFARELLLVLSRLWEGWGVTSCPSRPTMTNKQ